MLKESKIIFLEITQKEVDFFEGSAASVGGFG